MGLHAEIGVNVLVAAVGIGLLVLLIRRWRAARRASGDVAFLEDQLERAVRQIGSHNAGEILAGFQTLTKLRDTRSRLRALGQIRKLREHENAVVARQAKTIYDTIVSDLERAAE
jgi:hypothetical protein